MTSPDPLGLPFVAGDSTYDAVVVIPGIMGSRLVDVDTGRTLWGMEQALQYSMRWRHRRGMAGLHVTDDERAGHTGRIRPQGLLQFPAWAPFMGGIEPYTKLVKELRNTAVHPMAILEFAYDWRLSVEHNAGLLAKAADDHLRAWRAHPAHDRARRADPTGREGQLVLVAHSMGGLLCWAMARIPGATAEVRATITIGAPFHGSVQATEVLNSGRGAPVPLPHRHLRALASTLPGLHDLLPTYRCMDIGDHLVSLTAEDVAALGGDEELARDSFDRRAHLAAVSMRGHRLMVGTGQQTTQSLKLADGVVVPQHFRLRHHRDGELIRDAIGRPIPHILGGDGTVYRYAGAFRDIKEDAVAQQHGALPRCKGVIDAVCGVLTHAPDLQTVLGGGGLGLVVPDYVPAGEPFDVITTGVSDPARVTCKIENAGEHDDQMARPELRVSDEGDERLAVRVTLTTPGLYRVLVSAGAEPVTQLVLVDNPGQEGGD